ncbi:DNA-3-methyladenine glycosylase [Marinilabiliaceae bacterium JC017]|nr:DNA-3-methyladenine glycosylase [Marinilabiliaceae bacterium JC017]
MNKRLDAYFFERNALDIAPEILGKIIARRLPDGTCLRTTITEVEVYLGEEDLACHACKGRTPRTEIMYHTGGHAYVYLIYGMYWMLNFVTGTTDDPQAILIRGTHEANGPGKLGRFLQLDKSFYGENLCLSSRLWVESNGSPDASYFTAPRIGINYAGPVWSKKPWRYIISP